MKNTILIFAGALIIGILGGISGALLSPKGHVDKVGNVKKTKPVEEVRKEAIYYEVSPPFVASLGTADDTHFLQVDVVVMSYDEKSITAFEHHLPLIRNDLSFLFSSQSFAEVSTPEGKAKLRKDSLKVVRKIMEKNYGRPGIEDLLFTKLVTQ